MRVTWSAMPPWIVTVPPLFASVLHAHALPFQRAFHREVASFFMYDDHDILRNDCWPGQTYGTLTFDQGVGIFHEQTPSGSNRR